LDYLSWRGEEALNRRAAEEVLRAT